MPHGEVCLLSIYWDILPSRDLNPKSSRLPICLWCMAGIKLWPLPMDIHLTQLTEKSANFPSHCSHLGRKLGQVAAFVGSTSGFSTGFPPVCLPTLCQYHTVLISMALEQVVAFVVQVLRLCSSKGSWLFHVLCIFIWALEWVTSHKSKPSGILIDILLDLYIYLWENLHFYHIKFSNWYLWFIHLFRTALIFTKMIYSFFVKRSRLTYCLGF